MANVFLIDLVAMRIVPRLPFRLLGRLAIAYSIQVILFAVAYFVCRQVVSISPV
jgi:hypothetical protein